VSLWTLPPRELAVTLFQMIESGDGPAAFYADLTQAVLSLAMTTPPGPPEGAADFLSRLDAGWLTHAWAGHPGELAAVTAAAPHLGETRLR